MSPFNQNLSQRQKTLRLKRNEKAFLFNPLLTQCLGMVERKIWEEAISFCGGNVAEAAGECGLENIPQSAKALWGRSTEEALKTYRRWQNQRNK